MVCRRWRATHSYTWSNWHCEAWDCCCVGLLLCGITAVYLFHDLLSFCYCCEWQSNVATSTTTTTTTTSTTITTTTTTTTTTTYFLHICVNWHEESRGVATEVASMNNPVRSHSPPPSFKAPPPFWNFSSSSLFPLHHRPFSFSTTTSVWQQRLKKILAPIWCFISRILFSSLVLK